MYLCYIAGVHIGWVLVFFVFFFVVVFVFFFFNDTATTEIYTLSLHDALPICIKNEAEKYLKSVQGPMQ